MKNYKKFTYPAFLSFFEDLFKDINTHFVKFYIPWRVPYALLFLLEKFGLKLNFRSDSILSMWGNQ